MHKFLILTLLPLSIISQSCEKDDMYYTKHIYGVWHTPTVPPILGGTGDDEVYTFRSPDYCKFQHWDADDSRHDYTLDSMTFKIIDMNLYIYPKNSSTPTTYKIKELTRSKLILEDASGKTTKYK